MTSRREVFIRILPLLQRKTLIETKNRRLKCLKWHYSTVRSMKVQCWRRTGHLPSFCVPTLGDLTAQESPPPGICHPRQKNANDRGQPGGGRRAGRSWHWLMQNYHRQPPQKTNFLIVLLYIVIKITHGTQFIISHKKGLESVEIQLENHAFHAQPIDLHKFKLMQKA